MGNRKSVSINGPTHSTRLLPQIERVNVVVCSGSKSGNVHGLIEHIELNMSHVVESHESVRFEELQFNISDMNKFDFKGIDVLLLCHSIHNRGFSITDVNGALYDEFLQSAKKCLGWSKVGVIAHDFPEEELEPEKVASKIKGMRHSQSTTFECASLVLIGGQLSTEPIHLKTEQLNRFLHKASHPQKNRFLRCLKCCLTCGCYACLCGQEEGPDNLQ